MTMIVVGVVLPALCTPSIYLSVIRKVNIHHESPYVGFCTLFYFKYMLPVGHPLEFMYKGLPRNQSNPRLLWPCLAILFGIGFVVISAILAAVLSIHGILGDKAADTVFLVTSLGAWFGMTTTMTGIPELQNKICEKKMKKMDSKARMAIYTEIEKKWPGFFTYD